MDQPNFEKDLYYLFQDEARQSEQLCKDLWSSMANVIWVYKDGTQFATSFRYAGGIIADMLDDGSMYMDWYCSGPYETVTKVIAEGLASKGWKPYAYSENLDGDEDSLGNFIKAS